MGFPPGTKGATSRGGRQMLRHSKAGKKRKCNFYKKGEAKEENEMAESQRDGQETSLSPPRSGLVQLVINLTGACLVMARAD
jgi:hypothetical protein